MQVKDVMSSKPDILAADTTIRQAAVHMRDHENGAVPVFRDSGLIGMITDRDLVVRGLADAKTFDDSITSIMTDKVLYCFEDDDVESALNNMRDNQIQRLVVLNNRDKKDLVGIVSVADIADQCSNEETEKAVVECCRHYH